MKKIALHGSYFGDNFGDTLFVLRFLKWLSELDDYNKDNIFLPYAGERVRQLADVNDMKGIKSIRASDLVVFIGGGYLGEPSKNLLWSIRLIVRHLYVAVLAVLLQKPFMFIGVGAGPLSYFAPRKLTVFLCNKSQGVVVRDQESYDYLLNYGVKEENLLLGADSILNITSSEVVKEFRPNLKKYYDEKLIGIHLPGIKEKQEHILRTVLNDLKEYCSNNDNYKIVIFNDFYKESYNYLALNLAKELFNDYIEIEYKNPNQLIALIDELDIVITSKLHCGIVANCLGKDTLSISVHNKTKRLYRQLNLEERNVSLNSYKKGQLLSMLATFNLRNKNPNTNVPKRLFNLSLKNKEILLDFAKNGSINFENYK